MRVAAALLVCLTFVAASTLDQKITRADIIVDLTDIEIEGEYGDPLNLPALVFQLSPGQVVTGIAWTDLEYESYSSGANISLLRELVFSLSGSDPANYWDFRITNSANTGSSAGIVPSAGNTADIVQTYSSSGGNNITVGADGKLYLSFYELFDDIIPGTDSKIISGKLTIVTVPEPSVMLFSMAVAGCGIVARRLRSKKLATIA